MDQEPSVADAVYCPLTHVTCEPDMSKSLSSKEYARVRFGIGRPPGRQDPADFVLSDFSGAERKELDFLVDRAADVVEAVVLEGVEWAQNKYHGG